MPIALDEVARALLYATKGEVEIAPTVIAEDLERVRFVADILDAANVPVCLRLEAPP